MKQRKILQIILLILSAEIIYALPYVVLRIFRPTFLYAFDISNTSLGYCYTLYGITAPVFFIIGGLLVDRYQPKYLMSTALFLTGLGGIIWVLFPTLTTLYFLYVYWGIVTIVFFWSALIKVTRIWGNTSNQIIGFGLLEAGRGIVSAVIGTIGVYFFSSATPDMSLSKQELQLIIKQVYLIISLIAILLSGLLLFLPTYGTRNNPIITKNSYKKNLLKSFQYPVVWMLMLIIFSSYTGYRIGDIFTQYSSDIYSYNEKESASLGVFISYLRPIACVFLIVFSGYISSTKYLIYSFVLMCISSIFLILNYNTTSSLQYFINLLPYVSMLIGVYATRVLCFVVLKEFRVPIIITGTVIGIISVIGYTPDIFIGPLTGYYLDVVGGKTGYQYLFSFLLFTSLIGLFSAFLLHNTMKKRKLIVRRK